MNTFIKAQAALIAGSCADFSVTFLMVEVFSCWYLTANAAGNLTGATSQFILCRNWAFKKSQAKKKPMQVIKFALMWVGNIALSLLGVYLLTHHMHVNYLLSKLIVSAFLGVTYTYFTSKKFVFA